MNARSLAVTTQQWQQQRVANVISITKMIIFGGDTHREASVGSRLANHSGSLSLCALSLLWCTRLPSEEEEEEAESLRKEEGAEVEVEGRLAQEKKKDVKTSLAYVS